MKHFFPSFIPAIANSLHWWSFKCLVLKCLFHSAMYRDMIFLIADITWFSSRLKYIYLQLLTTTTMMIISICMMLQFSNRPQQNTYIYTVIKTTMTSLLVSSLMMLHCRHRRAGRSSEVERSLMVRWVIGSILHGGPIELFLIPASAPRLV